MKQRYVGLFVALAVSSSFAQPHTVPTQTPSSLVNQLGQGPYLMQVEFSSQDERAYDCAVEVARKQKVTLKLTTTVDSSARITRRVVSFSKPFTSLGDEADALASSVDHCQTSKDSKSSWSVSKKTN